MELNIPGDTFEETPDWWRNSIKQKINPNSVPYSYDNGHRINYIKQVLSEEYGSAILIQDENKITQGIFFPNPKYSTKFLLEFSK
jgi:hypothetical protein